MAPSAPKTPAKKAAKATAPKTTKAPAKKAAPAKKEAAAPAPAPVVEQNTVQEESASIESSMTTVLTEFSKSIQELTFSLNKMKADFKIVEKQVLREAKAMDKVNARRNRNKGSRAPSGFVKPAAISKELAKFLGVDEGTKMARTDVTKMITSYVKEHKLQASDNGRRIMPDTKLKALLKVTDKDEVTYFNLQKFMKHHFIKA